MLVLGLDTALKSCSVAVLMDSAVLAEGSLALEKGHAERLAPLVAAMLADARVEARALDRIGVVIGPGGFAGVRVGLALARGLMLGTNARAVGVTSLAALAAGEAAAAPGSLFAAVVDARRGQVYAALYGGDGSVLTPPFVAAPEEALARLNAASAGGRVLAIGDGAAFLSPLPANFRAQATSVTIDAKIVAQLAAAAPEPIASPSPLYLRAPDAKPGAPSRFDGLFAGPRL